MKALLSILIFLCLVFPVMGQEEGAAPPVKKIIPFSVQMEQASNAQGWSKIYYASFKRSGELRYLKLAAKNCANSIKVFKAVQKQFPSTTKFHHEARNRRKVACSYYRILQDAGGRSGHPGVIKDVRKGYCE